MQPRSYQVPAIDQHAKILQRFGSSLDSGDTGVGKTYIAIFTAKKLGWPVAIIAPKSTLSTWKEVCELVGVRYIFIENIERIAARKQYVDAKHKWNLPERCLLIFDEVHRFSGDKSRNAKLLASAPKPLLMLSATVADSPLKLRAIGSQL